MGNNVTCKTVRIGSIRMKIFDGQVRTLKDVRRVPDLRKNLLSLGVLEAHEYKFIGTDGALKITKNSMMVFKVECTTNLYKVIRSVVIGDISVATEYEDITRFWHMHLGHMSERGLRACREKKFYQVLNIANSVYISFAYR